MPHILFYQLSIKWTETKNAYAISFSYAMTFNNIILFTYHSLPESKNNNYVQTYLNGHIKLAHSIQLYNSYILPVF